MPRYRGPVQCASVTSTTFPQRATEHVAMLELLRQQQLDHLDRLSDGSGDPLATSMVELLEAELALVQTLCAIEQLQVDQAMS